MVGAGLGGHDQAEGLRWTVQRVRREAFNQKVRLREMQSARQKADSRIWSGSCYALCVFRRNAVHSYSVMGRKDLGLRRRRGWLCLEGVKLDVGLSSGCHCPKGRAVVSINFPPVHWSLFKAAEGTKGTKGAQE